MFTCILIVPFYLDQDKNEIFSKLSNILTKMTKNNHALIN